MNDEVWCSSQLLNQIQKPELFKLICQQFQVIIFSNTICDKKVQRLLKVFSSHSIVLLREIDTQLNKEQKTYWREQGLHGWIDIETLPSEIREKMFQAYTKLLEIEESSKIVENWSFDYLREELETSHIRLSKKEKAVLNVLIQAQGESVSRKEMCEQLWSEGQTNSNMSQLSCVVKRIQQKFEDKGNKNLVITTHWGKGYQLKMMKKNPKGNSWL